MWRFLWSKASCSRLAPSWRVPVWLVLGLLAGCGPDYSANTYNTAAVQQANKVERGVIVGLRDVVISSKGAAGTVTGAAVGGVAGSQAPGGGVGSALGAIGGSLIGGIVGSSVEQATADQPAVEYVVEKPNHELVSVTQKDEVKLPIGQRVLVIAGPQARIVPDYTIDLAPSKLPVAPAPQVPGAGSVTPSALPLLPDANSTSL